MVKREIITNDDEYDEKENEEGAEWENSVDPLMDQISPLIGFSKLDADAEDESEEYKEEQVVEEHEPNEKKQLPMDTYSGLLLAMVRFMDRKTNQKEKSLNLMVMLITIALISLLVCALELYVAFLLLVFVTERRADFYQDDIQRRIQLLQQSLSEGQELNVTDPLSFEAETVHVCWKDHSVVFSQTVLIFLWFVKVSIDAKASLWSTYICFRLPDSAQYNLIEEKEGPTFHGRHEHGTAKHGHSEVNLLRLTPQLRWAVFFFVNLPRASFSFLVAAIGARYLMYADNLMALIRKSVSLVFVSNINFRLYRAIAPAKFVELQSKTSFKWYSQSSTSGEWMLWGSAQTCVKMIFFASLSFLISRGLLGDVTRMRSLCNQYEEMFGLAPIRQILAWNSVNSTENGMYIFGYKFLN